MNNVYLVDENYDGGSELYTTVFSTYDKAKEYFDSIVDRELTNSWISDDPDEYIEWADEDNFYAYDDINGDSTHIYIIKKEIL